jgi:transposase-like protein
MKKAITYPPKVSYSEAFKRKIVREYERGHTSKDSLMVKYKIGGHSTVLQWCRKYGKFYYSNKTIPGRPLKDPEKQRIKELEHELKEARQRILVYEKLLEINRRETGIDIRKNIDTRLSESWEPKGKQ